MGHYSPTNSCVAQALMVASIWLNPHDYVCYIYCCAEFYLTGRKCFWLWPSCWYLYPSFLVSSSLFSWLIFKKRVVVHIFYINPNQQTRTKSLSARFLKKMASFRLPGRFKAVFVIGKLVCVCVWTVWLHFSFSLISNSSHKLHVLS